MGNTSSVIKFESFKDFRLLSKEIAHEALFMKYLHAKATLGYVIDPVTKALISDKDPFFSNAVKERIQELHDMEANRNFSSLDASQLLVEAVLKSDANKASRKLIKKEKDANVLLNFGPKKKGSESTNGH